MLVFSWLADFEKRPYTVSEGKFSFVHSDLPYFLCLAILIRKGHRSSGSRRSQYLTLWRQTCQSRWFWLGAEHAGRECVSHDRSTQ